VASRATVGIGSVYNHFPTYEALLRACAAEVTLITQPPQASTFEGIEAPAERLRLLVRELFGYYDRYHWFELIRCDRHKLPVVAQAVQRREQSRRELVREALRPLEPDEPTVTMVFALTDFAVHRALTRGRHVHGRGRRPGGRRAAGLAARWRRWVCELQRNIRLGSLAVGSNPN